MFVGDESTVGADVARVEGDRVEGRLAHRRYTRIGFDVRIPVVTVVGAFPLVEVGALAVVRKRVVPLGGRLQAGRVDAALAGEPFQ